MPRGAAPLEALRLPRVAGCPGALGGLVGVISCWQAVQ